MKYLLTIDYELYGNGSGNVFKHMIEPTRQLLDYFDTRDVKVTIFVEMVEILRIKEEWELGNTMGYETNPFESIARQLQDAYRRGHDIQLHIHPQWVDARFDNGRWLVDDNNWILGRFDCVRDITLETLLALCKKELEAIVSDADPNYQCIALRAGGYNVQPSTRLVNAMKAVGLKLDSSVVPGAVQHGKQATYDFTGCDRKLNYWYADTSLETPSQTTSGVLEIPLASMPMRRFCKFFSWARIKAFLNNSASAMTSFDDKTHTRSGNSIVHKIKYLLDVEYVTWDFCLMSKMMHQHFIKATHGKDIVVLVGHPKGFSTIDTVSSLISLAGADDTYVTVNQLHQMIMDGHGTGN